MSEDHGTDSITSLDRRKVGFTSAGTLCAAWHYPGSNGACVVMAGGFAVTKEPGTDRFTADFHEAGSASWPSTTEVSARAAAGRGRCSGSNTNSPTGTPL